MEISNYTFTHFKDGDNNAVAEVYFALKNLMFFVISTYVSNYEDCNDILDEAFIKVYECRCKIGNKHQLKSFASLVAKNMAIDFIKKKKDCLCEYIDDIYGDNDRTNEIINDLEQYLSNKEAIVVYYRIVFSYSWKEITEFTGIANSTARLLYKTALAKLRKELS